MGDDLDIVNAARVSFDKHKEVWDDKDDSLINFLAREGHLLPFRQVELKLRVKAPIFVARQMAKHQAGFTWSEVSRRYIKDSPEIMRFGDIRLAAKNTKQGSSDKTKRDEDFGYLNYTGITTPNDILDWCVGMYDHMIKLGAAPEEARKLLPQAMYTQWIWKGNLLGWHHVYKERTHPSTQLETRELAEMIGHQCADRFPKAWEALNEHCRR